MSTDIIVPIPLNQAYKIHILNAQGEVERLFVFCAGMCSVEHMTSLFSDNELAYYKEKNVDVVFSSRLIHQDDTIHEIKQKIVAELTEFHAKSEAGEYSLSIDELYLFGNAKKDLDMVKLYQDATNNETIPLTKERFFQYVTNINADPYILEANYNATHTLTRDVFNYDDWMAIAKSGPREICVPIGMDFQESYDFRFPSNPYHHQLWTQSVEFEPTKNNILLTFEKSVLLDYTNSTHIMVCLAKNVYTHAEIVNIPGEYFSNLYFPFLQKRGLTSRTLLANSAADIAAESSIPINSTQFKRKQLVLDTFREIYWTRQNNSELPYIERGIREYSLTIRASDYSHALPMDLLFRNLHATEQIPFIKYNPGPRRENMYRLYSSEISTDGRKIPLLSESVIMRLSRETGKGRQISIYIHAEHPIYVNIHTNSEIEITGSFASPVSVDALDKLLISHVAPIITQMNNILNPSGYTLYGFDGIYGFHVYKTLFTYQAVLPIENRVNLEDQLNYITQIFDVTSTDVSKGAKMRFKRVRNYREMDAKFSVIREIYDRTGNSEDVIQGLVDNFDITEQEAISLYGEFRSQFQVLNRRVIDNPGFPTEFQMRPLKNELVVEIQSISSPRYLDIIYQYIDTILRLSQKPKTVTISAPKLKTFKTKVRVSEKVVLDEVETVIAPAIAAIELYKPMQFHLEKDEEEDVPVETDSRPPTGLDFEDEFDYNYDEDVAVDETDDKLNDVESDDEYYGGVGTPEENMEYKANIDGMPIKNPSPFFKRMLERDPVLYVTEESSKFPLYSKACPSGDKRQPVILTDAEKKRIDETNPGSYGKALLYGSSEEKKFWYVCPRYWCLKTNSSISEKDAKEGKKCGAIIPRGSDRVPSGAYVYEFNNPKVHMKNDNYVQHVPGFLKKDKHPDGLCIPCCFSKEWDSRDQKGRREQCGYAEEGEIETEAEKSDTGTKTNKIVRKKAQPAQKTQPQKVLSYVMGSVSYPLPQNRWGFLPESLQLFLKTDNSVSVDPQNPALILSGETCILRYGVEKSDNQSFFACFSYYYAYKHSLPAIPSINEFRAIFLDSIDIDLFIRYHNGNLVSIFRPRLVTRSEIAIEKYSESAFYKTIDLNDETQVDYLEDTIASYENFIQYIQDEKSVIDHTYLWDFFCNRNPKLLLDGMNLVILQISDNDITEKVQMICPSNAYSHAEYNSRKETVILVKQDKFYEPVQLYEQHDTIVVAKTDDVVYSLKRGERVYDSSVIDSKRNVKYTLKQGETKKSDLVFKKAFVEHTALDEIKEMLKLIRATTNKYCAPLPSMPRKYAFKQNMPILDIVRILKTAHYQIISQILNYRNKTIGVLVKKPDDGRSPVFVPCFPSAIAPDLETKYMDDDSIWIDYRDTRDRLNEISVDTKGGVFTKPTVKIVEDGLVVGFLTETNQFVQIDPPTQSLDEDGIAIVEHSSNSQTTADKTLTTWKYESKTRRRVIRNINLETQFYNIFRSLVRIQLNDYDHRKIRQEILNTIDDNRYSYHGKLKHIEKQLHMLLDDKTSFDEINPDKLRSLETVVMCRINSDTQKCESTDTTGTSTKFCLTTDDGKCRTIFPKLHLISGKENQRIYFGRMADELIRYSRIRVFMFQPKTYMNITNTDLQINNDELFLLESRVSREYFRNIIPYTTDKYVHNIEYDNAHPEITQTYANRVNLDEQSAMTKNIPETADKLDDYILDCIQQTKSRVIGNDKAGSWRPMFPVEAKEIMFNNTNECSFIPIIYIFQQIYHTNLSVKNIKTSLWKEYSRLFENPSNVDKIYAILRNQGKRVMIDRVKTGRVTFETVLFSEEYYITDLDWWVFCKTAHLPVILFSSTTLKYLSSSITWLKLGGKGVANEKYFFVRSPVDIRPNTPPSYHVLQSGYAFSELKGTLFLDAERGDEQYRQNMIALDIYLEKTTFISKNPAK
jgi:hypothetical protein